MAYKFYHRYTVAEFQRYRDFFPKHAKVSAIRSHLAIEATVLQGTSHKTEVKYEPDSTTTRILPAISGVLHATNTDSDLPLKTDVLDESCTGGSVNNTGQHANKQGMGCSGIPRMPYAPTFYRGCSFPWPYHHLQSKPCATPSLSSSRMMSSSSPPSYPSPSRSLDETLTSVLASLPQRSSSSPLSQSLQLASSTSSLSSLSSLIPSSLSAKSNKRKSARPRRSAKRNDPKFRGVTFTIGTALRRNRRMMGHPKIYITSHLSFRRFNSLLAGRLTYRRWRRQSSGDCSPTTGDDAPSDLSSDDHKDEMTSTAPLHLPRPSTTAYHTYGGKRRCASSTRSKVPTSLGFPSTKTTPVFKIKRRRSTSMKSSNGKFTVPQSHSSSTSSAHRCALSSASGPSGLTGKQCRSCKTTRTPLWRDAEDGTPLCNACGIRYKKYRIRCPHCWLIPRKDSKTFPRCGHCGVLIRPHTRSNEES